MRRKIGLTIVPSFSFGITLAALLVFAAIGTTAHAAGTYYWDPANNGNGGPGTWDANTTSAWAPTNAGGSDVTWNASGATQAEFYKGTGTVTVNGAVSLQNLLFDATASGYTLNNGTSGQLSFNNTASNIGVNSNATLNVPIATANASTLLTISGNSTLALGGVSSFAASSSVTVTGGATVVITNTAAFGSGSTPWSLGAGTLDLQCGPLPAGQSLFNSGIPFTGSTPANGAFLQTGNFSIVSDVASSGAGVTYSGTNEIISIAGSSGGTSTGGTRTFSVVGGANVTGGTAGLYLPSLMLAGYAPTSNGTSYSNLNLNLINPSGGVTLLKVDNFALGYQYTAGAAHGVSVTNVTFGGGGDMTITTSLTAGSGSYAITLPAAFTGSVYLNGSNLSYSNSTVITGGTLVLGGSATGSLFLVNENNGLQFTAGVGAASVYGLTGAGNIVLSDQAGSPAAVNLGVAAGGNTYSGNLSGLGGFVKNGSGVQVLSGNNSQSGGMTVTGGTLTLTGNNTYAGNTAVNGGQLTAASTSSLPTWNSNSGKISVAAATTLAVSAGGTWTGTNIDTLLTNNSSGFSASGGLLGIDTGGGNFSYTPGTPIGTYQAGMGLNKLGANILTLGGANVYTGGTTISTGTLQMAASSPNALGNGPLSVTGVLDLNGNNLTTSGGTNALTGAGTVTDNLASSTVTLTTSVATGNTSSFSGAITNGNASTFAFVKTGSGALTLPNTNANTYNGGTTVSGGTLFAYANLPGYNTSGLVNVSSGATLQMYIGTTGNWLATVVTNMLNANAANIHGILSFDVLSIAGGSTEVANINGDMGVERTGGAFVLTMSGNNSYTGGTLITAGTLQMGNANALGSQSGALTMYGGVLDLQNNSLTVGALSGTGNTSIITSASNGTTMTLTANTPLGTYTYPGSIQNKTGTLSFIQGGPGTLILSGTGNTYGGTTAVNNGTLEAADTASLAGWNTSSKITVAGAATLAVSAGATWTGGNIDTFLTNNGAGFSSGGILGIDTNGQSLTYTPATALGTATGQVGMGLNKMGANMLTLGGANTYTGGTTISGGTLQLGSVSALGSSSGNLALSVATGVLDLNGQSPSVNYLSGVAGSIITSSSAATTCALTTAGTSANNSTTFAGNIQDGPSSAKVGLIMSGPGLLTLSGASNTYSGGTAITGGTLQAGVTNALGTGTLYMNGATGVFDLNAQSVATSSLSGVAGSIITNNATGTGTLTVNQASGASYAGSIQDGGPGKTTALILSGNYQLLLTSPTGNTYTGPTTINSGASVSIYSLFFNSSSILNNGVTLTFREQGSSLTYAGSISGTGNLTKTGNKQLTLTGANSYSGSTSITGGTLQVGSATALGTGSVNVAVGTTLDLNGQSLTIGALGAGTGLITSNSANTSSMLTTSGTSAGNSTTFAGWIQDGASSAKVGLTMNGPGMLILSNVNNTYSGGTIISGGTLLVSNASGSATGVGNVTMNGGVLASDPIIGGSISGNVLSGAGAHTIAPGGVGTIGQLNIGGLTTSGLTTLAFDLTTPSGSGDLLVVGANGVTVNPSTNIGFSSLPTTTGNYKLIEGTIVSGTLSNFVLPSAPPGETYSLSTAANPGYIDLVVAPALSNPTLAATANATLSNAQSGTFGPAVTSVVSSGASYQALASYVNGVTPAGNNGLSLATTATFGGGINSTSNSTTVSFAWRTRAPNESSDFTATIPPMGHAGNPGGTANFLASDVLRLTGMSVITGAQTDAYGLSLSYNATLVGTAAPYLGTLMPNGYWMNAINGDVAGTGVGTLANSSTPFTESLATFMSNNGLTSTSNLNAYVGDWGYDGSTAWAIINFQSDPVSGNNAFAVVPEPGTIALLLAGGLALLPVIRRRLRRA